MLDTPHDEVRTRIDGLLKDEDDWVTAMATVVCELHHAFDHFHWTGFYRTVRPNHLKVGPYQGGTRLFGHPLRQGHLWCSGPNGHHTRRA